MHVVLVNYQAKPGCGDEIAEIFRTHIPLTRAEQGCLAFNVHRHAEDPDQFVLYEQYSDEATLLAHFETEHYKRFVRDGIHPLLDERRLTVLVSIEPAGAEGAPANEEVS